MHTKGRPQTIAKLVNITPITIYGLYDIITFYNYSINITMDTLWYTDRCLYIYNTIWFIDYLWLIHGLKKTRYKPTVGGCEPGPGPRSARSAGPAGARWWKCPYLGDRRRYNITGMFLMG